MTAAARASRPASTRASRTICFRSTLLGVCARVDSLRVQEILDYGSYVWRSSPRWASGRPLDERLPARRARELLVFAWGHTLPLIAHALEVPIERIDTTWEKWPAARAIEYRHGTIAPGTCAAVRFPDPRLGRRRRAEDRPRARELASARTARPIGCARASVSNDAYRVIIEGSPSITQETVFRGGPTRDANLGGCLATGMRHQRDPCGARLFTASTVCARSSDDRGCGKRARSPVIAVAGFRRAWCPRLR